MDIEFEVETEEAESVNEAIDKAMSLYYDQKIVLYPEDCKGVDFLPCEQTTKSR